MANELVRGNMLNAGNAIRTPPRFLQGAELSPDAMRQIDSYFQLPPQQQQRQPLQPKTSLLEALAGADDYIASKRNEEMSRAYSGPKPDTSFDEAVKKVKDYTQKLRSGGAHMEYAADLLKTAINLKEGKNAPDMPLQLQMTPGFGDAYDVSEAIKYLGKHEYGKAALSSIGILPFVPGLAGIIAGKGAKTADLLKLDEAIDLRKAGVPREEIWNKTGWFEGVDGKWKFEIDDSANVYRGKTIDAINTPERLDDVELRQYLTGSDTYNAYPDAGDIRLGMEGGKVGSYRSAGPDPLMSSAFDDEAIRLGSEMDRVRRPSSTLHELQHGIQQREGFARGGSPEMFGAENMDTVRLKALWKKYADEGLDPMTARTRAESELAMENYKRLAGEAEARAVQTRMNLTPDQRAARPFWEDFDVPESDQIVRYGDGVSEMAAP